MKRISLFLSGMIMLVTTTAADAQVYVRPHVRTDGTYVPGHWRSKPNHTTRDNWSTYPNVNPYTGEQGNDNPYQIQTRPRYQPRRDYTSPLPESTQERWRRNMPLTCKYSDLC